MILPLTSTHREIIIDALEQKRNYLQDKALAPNASRLRKYYLQQAIVIGELVEVIIFSTDIKLMNYKRES